MIESLFPEHELIGPKGKVDLHSHILPGVDDGCTSLKDSLDCARAMVSAGYAHQFCTPHYWSSMPENTVGNITKWTSLLQGRIDEAGIPLRLHPGGEIGLRRGLTDTNINKLPTFGMKRKFALCDLWAARLPDFFEPTVRWMQKAGITVILAHPERMEAVQSDPKLADYFAEIGVLLQGNLQCLNDPIGTPTRTVGDRYLKEGRYTFLGSDTHNLSTLGHRLSGLRNALKMVGAEEITKLTVTNPQMLLT